MAQTVLRIDASGTGDASVTRKLNDQVIARFDGADVITRDLAADPLPFVDAKWNAIRGLPDDQLSDDDKSRLALSDTLIDEIRRADTLVISVPMYNFSIPAALKAWIDLVARVGVTFRYTPNGPEGLLKGKRAIIAMASGGTAAGSDIDFASGYLRHVLGFIGITDVTLIAADALAKDAEGTLARAHQAIDGLAMQAQAA